MKASKIPFYVIEKVERHPAWHGALDLKEILLLLENQPPFTYILSGKGPQNYHLSYITKNKKIKHAHFSKIFTKKSRLKKPVYCNGIDINFSSVDNLIRYKMKRQGSSIKRST